jgi:hypothetical protein
MNDNFSQLSAADPLNTRFEINAAADHPNNYLHHSSKGLNFARFILLYTITILSLYYFLYTAQSAVKLNNVHTSYSSSSTAVISICPFSKEGVSSD